ncbi:hypothetical protein GCM10023084_24420 [Streptomyces lacrimifluminis]|uniref:Uncharacterized protein n=1 Tax=Streptomyces lacrimifluminis TaxID=1500077 RepID=A0A917KIE1_9ACTN|nr:hypothetical protein [Streptomyces lacrimifluminis]GGJ14777.1 hypothetical protein GCM10012282_08840 [Streptomyces lacrimifluminis]
MGPLHGCALTLADAVRLQLLGSVWLSQTIPAVALSLFTDWFHPRALLVGRAAGLVAGRRARRCTRACPPWR